METRAHYVAVGAFVLTTIFLAFVAVLWLGRVEFAHQYTSYEIFFTGPVTGLNEGAPVQYNGIRVGRVVEIKLDPLNVEQIRVLVEIDSGVVIKSDAVAALETNILSGVSTIQIRGGTQEAPVLAVQSGQRYAVIASRRSAMERAFSRAPQLLGHLIEVTENLNALLSEHNRKAVTDSLDNIQTLTAAAASHSKELGDTLANANAAMVALSSLIRDVDQSYAGREGLGGQLSGLIGDYDKLAKNLQLVLLENRTGIHEFSQRGLSQINDLITETRQLVSGLTRLAADVERDPTRFLFGDRREGYKPR